MKNEIYTGTANDQIVTHYIEKRLKDALNGDQLAVGFVKDVLAVATKAAKEKTWRDKEPML